MCLLVCVRWKVQKKLVFIHTSHTNLNQGVCVEVFRFVSVCVLESAKESVRFLIFVPGLLIAVLLLAPCLTCSSVEWR